MTLEEYKKESDKMRRAIVKKMLDDYLITQFENDAIIKIFNKSKFTVVTVSFLDGLLEGR